MDERIEFILSSQCFHCSSEFGYPIQVTVGSIHELRSKQGQINKFEKKHENCGVSKEYLLAKKALAAWPTPKGS